MLQSFGWLLPLMRADQGLSKCVKPGDRVQHRGTKQWGEVLEVVPQRDGTSELRILREHLQPWQDKGEGWWATYHIGDYEPREERMKRLHAAGISHNPMWCRDCIDLLGSIINMRLVMWCLEAFERNSPYLLLDHPAEDE